MSGSGAFLPVKIAAMVLGLLLSPPVRELVLSRMSLHMNLQLPMLLACGAALGWPWRDDLARALRMFNPGGVAGLLLVSGGFGVWMVPRALDAAVADPAVDTLKVAALLLSGGVLVASWRSAHAVVQAFFVGNAVWMSVSVGFLFVQAPERLCNAYLENDQRWAGYGLAGVGCAVGVAWLVGVRGRLLEDPAMLTASAELNSGGGA